MTDPRDDDTVRVRAAAPEEQTRASQRRRGGDAADGAEGSPEPVQVDTAPIDLEPTATRPAARAAGGADDTLVARDPASRRREARDGAGPATHRRRADDGRAERLIYARRADAPVVAARTPPPVRRPHAPVDAAEVSATMRRAARRRVIWLALAAAAIVLAGLVTAIVLAVAG